jgi:hypothetical protein
MNGQKSPSQHGCEWVERCIEICTARSIHVEEKGVRATFTNSQRKPVRKIHYDGCFYTGRGKRADYIVGLPETIDLIVELKGTDTNLKDAARQVEKTLDKWEEHPMRARLIAALIIYGRVEGRKKLPGRVPRTEAVILGLRAELRKRRGLILRIHENGEQRFKFRDFSF